MRPIIKWSGSKRSVAKELAKAFPAKYGRFVAPFVGGASILEYVDTSSDIVAGDVVPQLVDILNMVSVDSDRLVQEYAARQAEFLKSDRTPFYLQIRDRFNSPDSDADTRTHDFYWVMLHCYNGLVRFNKAGQFNVSLHFGRDGVKVEKLKKDLNLWQKLLAGRFVCRKEDYRQTLSYAKSGDFVFLDPPYVATNGMYLSACFDYKELFYELDRLNKNGIRWMLTLDKDIMSTRHAPDSGMYTSKFQNKAGVSHFRNLKNKQELYNDTVFINY